MSDRAIVPIPNSEPVDQTRALRVVLAYLDDDLAQLTAVSEEVASDVRGPDLALWQLVATLGAALTEVWLSTASEDSVRNGIRQGLIENEREKDA